MMHDRCVLDGYDRKILQLWQERGDIGPVEMGQHIHLSPSQCSRRMQALRAAGFITSIEAVIDAKKVGIGVMAYVLVTMERHDAQTADAFHARMRALDEVLDCQKLTGAADMIVKIATRDLASFNEILTRELLAAPEVATAQSSIILENIKSTTRLPLGFLP
jgi:Lrp/AsnC family transcriptional regulator, leucine-responsive regulatory protein